MKTLVDMQYGARMLDNRNTRMTVCADAPLLFNGIEVKLSEMALTTIGKLKRWKRKNRPDKYRDTRRQVPGVYHLKPQNIIIMHPEIWEKVERSME